MENMERHQGKRSVKNEYLSNKEIEKLEENARTLGQPNNLRILKNLKEARNRIDHLENMYVDIKEKAEPLLMGIVKKFGGGHSEIRQLFNLLGINPSYSALFVQLPKKYCTDQEEDW